MSQSHHPTETDDQTWWIARPENTEKIWRTLVFVCISLVLVDFVYHGFFHEKHGYFVFETAVAFHAGYGFGAFVFVVLLGKELRKLIMRPENYYDDVLEETNHSDVQIVESTQGGQHD
jgi:hypothetical protein